MKIYIGIRRESMRNSKIAFVMNSSGGFHFDRSCSGAVPLKTPVTKFRFSRLSLGELGEA